ncbi:hypothetical protein MUK42_14736 [Musa troglodytarum]|uniref:DNA sliding clamp PCNA n=1 Tax=Musa troglodytarum TaxID=320322 RepID=A0A9E7I895_9LILI|nr:hypothetical protein MUK42_14736 [Musa troglodytarum]
MLELRLVQGSLLKKVLEAIRELVTDANFDCSATGFSLQAMDSSHVALVALLLRSEGFEHYRCDRNLSMGMNLNNVSKMLRCAGNNDIITVKADDGSDTVTFMFESPSTTIDPYLTLIISPKADISRQDRRFRDEANGHRQRASWHSGRRVPSYRSDAVFRICKDMQGSEQHWGHWYRSNLSSTLFRVIVVFLMKFIYCGLELAVIISVTKEGVKFSTAGDIGTANIVCRQNKTVDKPEEATIIEMQEPVSLTFALRYMNSFTKATPLSETVTISLSSDLPVVVEYKIAEMGYIRFYLAPKIEEEDDMKP